MTNVKLGPCKFFSRPTGSFFFNVLCFCAALSLKTSRTNPKSSLYFKQDGSRLSDLCNPDRSLRWTAACAAWFILMARLK